MYNYFQSIKNLHKHTIKFQIKCDINLQNENLKRSQIMQSNNKQVWMGTSQYQSQEHTQCQVQAFSQDPTPYFLIRHMKST